MLLALRISPNFSEFCSHRKGVASLAAGCYGCKHFFSQKVYSGDSMIRIVIASREIGRIRVEVLKGNIASQHGIDAVVAVVNPSNSAFRSGICF